MITVTNDKWAISSSRERFLDPIIERALTERLWTKHGQYIQRFESIFKSLRVYSKVWEYVQKLESIFKGLESKSKAHFHDNS